MDLDDAQDPTDWKSTKFPFLFALESSLRCQICKEYLNSPVITSCGHTFCSLCIRRCLTSDQRCPTCRATEEESKLRKNNMAQEAVDAFAACRGVLMEFATAVDRAPAHAPLPTPARTRTESTLPVRASRRHRQQSSPSGASTRLRTTRSMSSATQMQSQTATADDDVYLIVDSEESDEEVKDGGEQVVDELLPERVVRCPICNLSMEAIKINSHIDKCLDNTPSSPPSSHPQRSSSKSLPSNFSRQPQSSSSTKAPSNPLSLKSSNQSLPSTSGRLPKLNYQFITEKALRSKLADLQLPTSGNKQTLQLRHMEWVNLWNANLDSPRPKGKNQLVKELKAWESVQNRPSNNRTKREDWDDEGWERANRDQFRMLAEQARKKRKVGRLSKGGNHGQEEIREEEDECSESSEVLEGKDVIPPEAGSPTTLSFVAISQAVPLASAQQQPEKPSSPSLLLSSPINSPVRQTLPALPRVSPGIYDSEQDESSPSYIPPLSQTRYQAGRSKRKFGEFENMPSSQSRPYRSTQVLSQE